MNKSLEATQLLIDAGTDPNELGHGNVLAIHDASLEVVKYLISVGANVNKIGYEECTPLMYEVYVRNIKNVQYLIKQGVDVNYQRKLDGYTSLHFAAQRCGLEMIQLLLKHGAHTHLKNDKNQTALDLAKEKSFTEALDILKP